ncbi:hypothetical protein P261_01124 [Lachnospiraceae bacterium TWA4]|nr:hypothetical protein P261_01124 [Lachnospiraceae bacterium TWA4]
MKCILYILQVLETSFDEDTQFELKALTTTLKNYLEMTTTDIKNLITSIDQGIINQH